MTIAELTENRKEATCYDHCGTDGKDTKGRVPDHP